MDPSLKQHLDKVSSLANDVKLPNSKELGTPKFLMIIMEDNPKKCYVLELSIGRFFGFWKVSSGANMKRARGG